MQDSLKHFDSLPDSAHVRLPIVAALFACSHATVWRGVQSGKLPKPIKHFERTSAWNVGELRHVLRTGHSRHAMENAGS
jgi:predicted DNA-binding transcriptional regulator AlpA